jgi:hypothetical protein
MAAGEPAWLGAIDRSAAAIFLHHGTVVLAVTLIIFATLAVAMPAAPRVRRHAVVLVVALAAALWILENLGGIATGSATDVNTGPLLALFALAFLPSRGARGAGNRETAGLSPVG